MGRKSKYSKEIKLSIVKRYLAGEGSIVSLAREINSDESVVWGWVKKYQAFGENTFNTSYKNASYTKDFKEKHCDSIKGEFKSNGVNNELKHTEGVLSMARTMIKDSASSQFFIMHKPAPHLDGEYAAFGKITEGLDIVDQIANVPTNFQDCPTTPVVIKTIRRA